MNSIKHILQPIGIPTEHMFYKGKATTYIVYQVYNENGEAFAENIEIETSYYVQVDIYSLSDEELDQLYTQTKGLMMAAGYYRRYASEMYEPVTKLNHKVIRFQYAESSQT